MKDSSSSKSSSPQSPDRALLALGQAFTKPSTKRSILQLLTTFVPLAVVAILSNMAFDSEPLVTVVGGALAGFFLVRVFIIQHDCGHGSFFQSRKANDVVGRLCSVLTLIPYLYWRRQHALHHAGNANLDRRGHGDIDVYTVSEYLALSKWERVRYRLYRNPIVFLLLGPIFLVLVVNRFAFDKEKSSARERRSVVLTNLLLLPLYSALAYAVGPLRFCSFLLPAIFVAGALGIWLFYIQHQFEHTYWKKKEDWDYVRAAMAGSSYYRLPRVLRWFSGDVGYHHIHHLIPHIPNYRLAACHESDPKFQEVYEVTLLSSFRTMFLSVWDEELERLISFRELRRRYPQFS